METRDRTSPRWLRADQIKQLDEDIAASTEGNPVIATDHFFGLVGIVAERSMGGHLVAFLRIGPVVVWQIALDDYGRALDGGMLHLKWLGWSWWRVR